MTAKPALTFWTDCVGLKLVWLAAILQPSYGCTDQEHMAESIELPPAIEPAEWGTRSTVPWREVPIAGLARVYIEYV